ncbi:MAG: transglycosylase SLT domain-containing protein [Methylovulum sp.]|jgi:soluble lytic murein transglycosylase-like protein|nr:transglycosylase SLT domain-containing protein [Methylovulum sp.]MCF7998749.1 transglycosylase SLT domain-containing protein [Methylovulum sp.]
MILKWVTALCLLVSADDGCADIYKFIDSNGHTYYTNSPKTTRYLDANGQGYYADQPRNLVSKQIFRFKTRTYTAKDFTPQAVRYFSANKRRYSDLIEQTAFRHQVDPKLVHAVIQTESAYNSSAISSAGAIGLMQLMPGTAKRFGVDNPVDPNQNVEGGIRYLKHLLGLFDSNLDLAVAAYNAGENAVIKYNHSIPPYPETQNYVKQVLALYKH